MRAPAGGTGGGLEGVCVLSLVAVPLPPCTTPRAHTPCSPFPPCPAPQDVLDAWCTDFVPTQGYSLDTPACQIYPDEITDCSITALEQCTAEQKYVRGAMTRALLYLQVRFGAGGGR